MSSLSVVVTISNTMMGNVVEVVATSDIGNMVEAIGVARSATEEAALVEI